MFAERVGVLTAIQSVFPEKKEGEQKRFYIPEKRQQKIIVAHNTPFPPFQCVGTTTSSQIKKTFLGCQKKGILRRRK